jgi:hypothetical protein
MALNRGTPKGAARVHFNPIKIDYNTQAAIGLIQQYGSRYDWWQALVCPCTLAPQQNDLKFRQLACGLCNGTGWTYVFTKEIRAVPSSNRREEQTLTYRVAQPGIMSNIFVNLTCEPEYKVNIRDRMIFKESVTFRSEAKIYDPTKETYKFTFPIVELMQVLDQNGTSYDCRNLNVEDRDVDSNDSGLLVWNEGKCRPPSGVGFSALYTFFPSYIVITAAHEIRGTVAGKPPSQGGEQAFEDLPRLFTAKLEIPDSYLFG